MTINSINAKLQKLNALEAEVAEEIAIFLHQAYSLQDSFYIAYSESMADDSWLVGLSQNGLFFGGYAYDLYVEVSENLGVTPQPESVMEIFVQDLQYFKAVPIHVLKYLYNKFITIKNVKE